MHNFARIEGRKLYRAIKVEEYTNLREQAIRYMPESFDKLEYLIYLNVAQTRIEQAPETIGKIRSLRHLNLSETGVRNLPEAFGGLRSLQTLLLSHCRNLVKISQNIALGLVRLCRIDGSERFLTGLFL
jgi:Leucine-rich repeat (LRR) protein